MIKYIRDEGEDRPVSRIVFNNSLFYPIYISSSEKDEKDEKDERSIERFVFLRVSFIRLNVEWNSLLKKKGIVISYGAYRLPLIFNSIETL